MRGCGYLAAFIGVLGGCIPAQAGGSAIELRARGFQVYACAQAAGAFAWHLKGPDAVLTNDAGAEMGRHFAGPSWQAKDGSTVVGETLVASPSPAAGSIPWLVLRAKSHSGDGAFASVGYIARLQTEGGAAPTAGCDQSRAGAEARVPYNAVYVLFPQP